MSGLAVAATGVVVPGVAGAVLFSDGAGGLAQDGANLSFDDAANRLTVQNLRVAGLTPNGFVYAGASGDVASTAAATDGQVLIGRTGNTPVAAALTAGANITITPGAGSITIAGAAATTLNGLSGAVTLAGTANQVTVGAPVGQTITLSTPQNLATASVPQFAGLGIGVAGSANTLKIAGATSGVITHAVPAVAGTVTVEWSNALFGGSYISFGRSGMTSANYALSTAPGLTRLNNETQVDLAINNIPILIVTSTAVTAASKVVGKGTAFNEIAFAYSGAPTSGIGWYGSGGTTIVFDAGTVIAAIYNGGMLLSNTGMYRFNSTVVGSGIADTALARAAAGQVEINNTTAGQYRDLKLRRAIWDPTETIASGASATLDTLGALARTITLTGATGIATATGFNLASLYRPTYSAASALTIDQAATLYIENAPLGGGAGPATITNPYALWIDAGVTRLDGNGTHVLELPADATDPTAGGGAAFGRIPVKVGGVTKYLAYY